MQQLIGVQYLRAIAAVGVVLYHIGPKALNVPEDRYFVISFLQSGVDLFFVISGFIIWLTLRNVVDSAQTWAWFRARLTRVVPLYWIATILAALLFESASTFNWVHLLKSLFFLPYVNDEGATLPLLAPGWTLNYEMLFYSVAGMAALLSARSSIRLLVIFVVLLALVGLRKFVGPLDLVAIRWTSPLLLEFLLGVLIAIVLPRLGRFGRPGLISVALSIAAVAFVVLVSARIYGQSPRVISAGVPSALLLLSFLFGEQYLRRFVSQGLRVVGDASYALYLAHPFVIAATFHILQQYAGSHGVFVGSLALVLSILIGIAVHYKLEKPLINFLRR